MDSLLGQTKPVYPFTISHAASKTHRKYTLYAASEAVRTKWKNALVDAKGVLDARRDANKVTFLCFLF